MNNIYKYVQGLLLESYTAFLADENIAPKNKYGEISIELPPKKEFGEISTNIALLLSKEINSTPMEVGQKLSKYILKHKIIDNVKIVKPGFINLWLKKEIWLNHIVDVIKMDSLFGSSNIDKKKKINVEFVSANPTGPVHIGHCRGAVYGDVLANILKKVGHEVVKEYYINDTGVQIKNLANSVLYRYQEFLKVKNIDCPDGFYPGEYLIPIAKSLMEKHSSGLLKKPKSEILKIVIKHTVENIMNNIKVDLQDLGVEHDNFISEYQLQKSGKVSEAIEVLERKNLLYEGVLEKPKGGSDISEWEPRKQVLFRSSNFGDDTDRPLKKSDGSWTYFASDIAYHLDKYQRGYVVQINVLGADHGGYVKRMNAAVGAVSGNNAEFVARVCQMVKLFRGGKQVKMSKRAGEFITIKEILDEVGSDSLRFMMLYRKNDAPLDFDFIKVKEQSKDNPVFYVQYANARIESIFRNIKKQIPEYKLDEKKILEANFNLLNHEHELDLVKKISAWPMVLINSSKTYEPHRVAYYLYELSSLFHLYWTAGKSKSDLRFIVPNNLDLMSARLGLVKALSIVIHSGLDILGVSAPAEMK